jgi:hypothetical protein
MVWTAGLPGFAEARVNAGVVVAPPAATVDAAGALLLCGSVLFWSAGGTIREEIVS